ncbi:hypothetical protein GCM10027277_57950 [Pseudoduganella ginsengisoli]|uniref:Type II/III secretion system secretin-like domain-containing protein n=1 Tax=Pseudoduganella ginsengisoli TaxID=1462440 RepID=A0A6L6Q7Z6_9BURK|nr:hypothetical protein [Pseudoduganella ginsengisoli]MTW05897.1 hypothetical protein [Pseudoduganella ginsengisoli]
MKNYILPLCSTILIISGCASTQVKEAIKTDYTASAQQIADATNKLQSLAPIILPVSNVPYLGRTSVAAMSDKSLPAALRSTQRRRWTTNYAFDVKTFGRMISEETGLPVDVNMPPMAQNERARTIDLSPYPAMTTKELLELALPQLGVDYEWDGTVLRLASTFTRVFEFDKSSSNAKGKMVLGKSSQSQVGTSGANSGTSGNFKSELESAITNDVDQWADTEASLKAIAGDKNVIPNKSLSVFTVTCSKTCLKEVSQFMTQANTIVTRQVHFSVMEVAIASTKTGKSAVNWNAFYQKIGATKAFSLSTPASLVQSAAGGLGIKVIDPTSPMVGSDALFQALSESSTVVDSKPYDLMALNNEATTLGNTDQQSYVSATSVVPTGVAGNPVFSQTPGYVTFGQFIQVIPTVLSGGRVIIRFGLDDTKLKQITTGQKQGEIDRVLLGALNFNNQAIVRSGATLVLSGFKRKSHKLQERGLIEGQKLGSEAGDTEITETVIMITPTVTGS